MQLRGYSRADTLNASRALLDRVGLAKKHDSLPRDLSGGQRQRVAIARAVAGDAPLILADEPTASLDAQSGLAATELLKQLVREQGRTVVCVTHDNRIFHLADRILEMEDGLVRRSVS